MRNRRKLGRSAHGPPPGLAVWTKAAASTYWPSWLPGTGNQTHAQANAPSLGHRLVATSPRLRPGLGPRSSDIPSGGHTRMPSGTRRHRPGDGRAVHRTSTGISSKAQTEAATRARPAPAPRRSEVRTSRRSADCHEWQVRWASRQTWSSRSGNASSPTPWPPPRQSTGWYHHSVSSWSLTSPATACATQRQQWGHPKEVNCGNTPIDANRQHIVDAGQVAVRGGGKTYHWGGVLVPGLARTVKDTRSWLTGQPGGRHHGLRTNAGYAETTASVSPRRRHRSG